MNKIIQETINDVLSEFDFEKVHAVMKALGWGWISNNDRDIDEVPSISRLVITAKSLLEESYKYTDSNISFSNGVKRFVIGTGGLYASVEIYENGDAPFIELSFVLTSMSSYDF